MHSKSYRARKLAIAQSALGIIKLYEDTYGKGTPIVLIKEIGEPFEDWMGVVLFPAIGERRVHGFRWQLTEFSEDGFTGHELFKDRESAIQKAVERGYTVPEPDSLENAVKSVDFKLLEDEEFKVASFLQQIKRGCIHARKNRYQ